MLRRCTAAVSLCALAAALPAQADPFRSLQNLRLTPPVADAPAPALGSWVVMDELMTVGSFYAPMFVYTSATPLQIDITDLFVVSDRNEVYLDGLLLGATPAVPDWSALFPAVGPLDDAPYTASAAVAWTRPEFSKSSFALPAGTHALTFRNIHIPLDTNGLPFVDGTAAFRLVVPEPTTGLLAIIGGALLLGSRRRLGGVARRLAAGRGGTAAAALLAVGLILPSAARATPCGPISVDVISNVLEVQGTSGADSIRLAVNPSNSAVIDVFCPVSAGTPSCSYDSTATPFTTIRVQAGDGDDLVIFDDSYGIISSSWDVIIDGGDGSDTVLGGVDLNTYPLANAMAMIASLQQAQTMLDRVLNLLDASGGGCQTVPCLVENAANNARDYANNLVKPTAIYVRDINSELVQPSANTVRDAHTRIKNYLQTFVAGNVLTTTTQAQTMSANVEVNIDQFELLLPIGQDLISRVQSLYARASSMGLVTQSGDPINVFMQTIESHVTTITEFADLCAEDPEPTETDFNEDNQDPSGLPPFCAEAERRIEALEVITDDVESRINSIEADGDQYETDGDALESQSLALGDDEVNTSAAAMMEADGDALVTTGDNLTTTAEAMNADWEAWITGVESDLETRGNNMHTRGLSDIQTASNNLRGQTATDIEAAAAALHAEADQIVADLNALMVVAAPLLRDDLMLLGGPSSCPVTPSHTIMGGPGSDILIGTTGSDRIEGGSGNDLIVGAGGADLLYGDGGNDLIFGGGGNDEIHGGADVDILIGNAGNDCIFGGGGQTITRGSLSVELGDLFFGNDGNDSLVSGESESDTLTEIDVAFGNGGDDRIRLSNGGTLTVGSFSFQFGNLAFGNGGNDDIATADGLDVIFGGKGEDTISTGKGSQLTIGSGSSQFRLALGDLIFGGDDNDTIDSDDPAGDRADDDIDFVFGGAGNDTINAYGGGDISIGDVSNPDFELKLGNLIFGGTGEDTIATLDGIDVIFGEEENDTISTAKGAQLTIGSGSNQFRLALGDLIFGGAGEDTIDSDDPAGDRDDDDIDVIFGGDDNDTIHGYGGGMLSIGDVSDPDFELKIGNVVFGGDGDDEIETLDGIDLIFGGNGGDTVSAGKGAELNIDDSFKIDLGDLIFGQDGDDILHGDAADPPTDDSHDGIDVIFGGTGADQIYGGTGGLVELPDQNFCLLFGNLMFGGPDDDIIRGDYLNWDVNDKQGGIDIAFGAGGNDTIEGAEGSMIVIGDITTGQAIIIGFGNLLFGGPGNDTIRGANTAELCTGVSDDLDDLLSGLGIADLNGAADLIFCGSGNDDVDAYNGIDFVFGSDGMDNLRADNGGFIIVPISGVPTPIALGNIMFGGDDDDIIRSLGRVGLPTVPPIEIDLLFGNNCDDNISCGDGMNIAFGNKGNDTITTSTGLLGINLLFGNSGEDTITTADGLNVAFGNRENDVITAGNGINVLFGNRGNDTIQGGAGLNVAFGNKGDDIVWAGPGLSILFGNSGRDDVKGGAGLSLCFGNRDDDLVRGGNGVCVLFGNQGNDDVIGGNGVSVEFGNSGHDVITSGAGLAVLFGNSGEDRLRAGPGLCVEFGNRDNDIIESSGGLFVAFGNRDDDVLVGAGGLNLMFGNANTDQFFGGGGTNIIFGNNDTDYIRGGGSVDFLFGNRGNDTIVGNGSKDFIFGNRDDDTLVSDSDKDFLFGNRGNDTVRSGGDGSDKDYLFGNRGNDSLFGCSNADKLYGGRGSDSKNRNDCNGASLPTPSRGEVRGRVMIDLDGDNIGDIPHAGVTVFAGASSTATDADGYYRIANLPVGSQALSETVPSGYTQVSGPAINPAVIGSMGIDLYRNENFVNRENCYVSPDSWSCLGAGCSPNSAGLQCRPVLVRRVMRCPDTGAICDVDHDCPCSDCVPSWAVVECACVGPGECFLTIDPVTGPTCGSDCLSNDGTVHPCQLVVDGDLYHCECDQGPPPCPTELAKFTFSGTVTAITPSPRPAPWNTANVGDTWTLSYWFARFTTDQNPGDPFVGDYPAITFYQLTIGSGSATQAIASGSTLIRNNSGLVVPPDRYTVQFQAFAAASPVQPTMRLMLSDFTSTAWLQAGLNPHDKLPLCNDIVLSRFADRIFSLSAFGAGAQWQISGNVTAFECTDCAPPTPVPTFLPRVSSESLGDAPIEELPQMQKPEPAPATPLKPRRAVSP